MRVTQLTTLQPSESRCLQIGSCVQMTWARACREPSWRFIEDMRVPKPRATHNDYTHSRFDRGHMVPAADRSKSLSSMKSTFLLTNVAPQVPSLNRGEWAKIERACRAYARNGHPLSIHVDAVFWLADTQLIGGNKIAVPHGFVKTVEHSWVIQSYTVSTFKTIDL